MPKQTENERLKSMIVHMLKQKTDMADEIRRLHRQIGELKLLVAAYSSKMKLNAVNFKIDSEVLDKDTDTKGKA